MATKPREGKAPNYINDECQQGYEAIGAYHYTDWYPYSRPRVTGEGEAKEKEQVPILATR